MLTAWAGPRDDYRAWLRTVKNTHERQIRVRVLNLDHKVLSTFATGAFVDGQVTIDTTRDVSRVLNISLLDPSRSIGWEPDSPSSLPTHMRRMLQVLDGRLVPGVGWLWCPCFTGPVMDFDRDGALVSIVADGKDRLAMGEVGRNLHYGSKRKVTTVIRELLLEAGEAPSRIHLPELDETLPKALTLHRGDAIWPAAKKLAQATNRVIYFDGRGHVRMRRIPAKPVLTLDRDTLAAPVRLDRAPIEVKNRWVVMGPKPKGDKKRVVVDIKLPAKHPYSGQSLGRNGKPRWLMEVTTNSSIKNRKKATEIAVQQRNDQQNAVTQATIDCLPFPHLEEYDRVKAVDPAVGVVASRATQLTLPLSEGVMTIGEVNRVAIVKRGRRKKGPKK